MSWLSALSGRYTLCPKAFALVGVTLSNFQSQSGSEAAELPLS